MQPFFFNFNKRKVLKHIPSIRTLVPFFAHRTILSHVIHVLSLVVSRFKNNSIPTFSWLTHAKPDLVQIVQSCFFNQCLASQRHRRMKFAEVTLIFEEFYRLY